MKRILQKRMWLAGASLLAIVLGTGNANADVFGGPGGFDYIIPSTGYYDFTVAGADGGGEGLSGPFGGKGAVVGGALFFDAGATLDIIVGGGGGSGQSGYGGGGGGGSFVFGGGLLFAAGGGGGAGFNSETGSPGIGSGGHPGGPASYGGGGGSGVSYRTGDGPQQPAEAGSFPNGGSSACCYFGGGPSGGYGGGGGGGYNGGGGGGGAPGGAGGPGNSGGGGGSSYVINTARNAFGITGGNMSGYTLGYGPSGYVAINFVAAPEASTWAMTVAGFAGLGWLARMRRRRTTA
jgi:hypothetical protein